MGITRGALGLLLELKNSCGFQGKMLQLGRQEICFTYDQLKKCAPSLGARLNIREPQGPIDDVALFKALGFDVVHSLDCDDYERATLIHDLNREVPEALWDQYDVIFDCGTLEHVFDLPQALRNIHRMLKKNGLIIHASPSHNFVDHGFYMFSPTLFYDYYAANRYRILKSYYFEMTGDPMVHPWKRHEYTPGCLDHRSFGGFGDKLIGTWFVAQKTPQSTYQSIPSQSYFVRRWKRVKEGVPDAPGSSSPNRIKNFLKKSALLTRMVRKAKIFYFDLQTTPRRNAT